MTVKNGASLIIIFVLGLVIGPEFCTTVKVADKVTRLTSAVKKSGSSKSSYLSGAIKDWQSSNASVKKDNGPCISPNTGLATPLASMSVATTSADGSNIGSGLFSECARHNSDGTCRRHTGIDLNASAGTPVYALCDGVIGDCYNNTATEGDTKAGGGYGNYVTVCGVISNESVHAFYAHLSSSTVKPGDIVRKGQLIGYTGTTGNAYGVANPHLHLEIRKGGDTADNAVDPESYINGEVTSTGSFANMDCGSSSSSYIDYTNGQYTVMY